MGPLAATTFVKHPQMKVYRMEQRSYVQLQLDQTIARLTLQRPPVNAIDDDLLSQLDRALAELEGIPKSSCRARP